MSPRSSDIGSSVMKSKTIRKRRAVAGWAGAILAPVLASTLFQAAVWAQYSGQVTKKTKDGVPDLRAIAVLEWTGDLIKPKTARIVPIAIFDGEKLQDAGIYLARPQPLALTGEVEYELKRDGRTFGFFDIQNAGQDQGTWVGFGKWKPLPPPKPLKAAAPAKVDDYSNDEKPVLHRKKDSSASGGSGSSSDSGSGSGPADPDRPTLHKSPSDKTLPTVTAVLQAQTSRRRLRLIRIGPIWRRRHPTPARRLLPGATARLPIRTGPRFPGESRPRSRTTSEMSMRCAAPAIRTGPPSNTGNRPESRGS